MNAGFDLDLAVDRVELGIGLALIGGDTAIDLVDADLFDAGLCANCRHAHSASDNQRSHHTD